MDGFALGKSAKVNLVREGGPPAEGQDMDDENKRISAVNPPVVLLNRFAVLSRNIRGNVFFAGDNRTLKVVVLRMLRSDAKKEMQKELSVYQSLWNDRDWNELELNEKINIPCILMKGQDPVQNTFVFFVQSYVGTSLETLHLRDSSKISRRFLCGIAHKGLKLLKILHEEGYVHRDIHPGNFLIKEDDEVVSLIDYQSAKTFQSGHEDVGQSRTGSLRSLCSADMRKRSYCRRDDIEAFALMLVNLRRKKLPWLTKKYTKAKNYEERLKYMVQNHLDEAINFINTNKAPKVFSEFLTEFMNDMGHDFQCEPDYDYWIHRFKETEESLRLQS